MFWINGRAGAGRTVACLLFVAMTFSLAAADKPSEKTTEKAAEKTIYDYSLVGSDGMEISLSTFKGKVLLIVNLSSQSIFKNQMSSLETLQKAYKDKGLVILGVPCNDFGALEPGDDADIRKIYTNDFHLDFPIFSRTSVRGKDQSPLYGFLTGKKDKTGGDIHWTFTKFIVDRTGKVVARFEPDVDPGSPELEATVEDVLTGKFESSREKGEKENTTASGEDDDDR